MKNIQQFEEFLFESDSKMASLFPKFFLSLSPRQKMDWLTNKYSGSNNKFIKKVDSRDDGGEIMEYYIYWSGQDPEFPANTVTMCYIPEKPSLPGMYQKFQLDSQGVPVKPLEMGYWGESIAGDFKKDPEAKIDSSAVKDQEWEWKQKNAVKRGKE